MATIDWADDLLSFIEASPTPYHAVAEARRRLEAAGYRELHAQEPWKLSSGDRVFTTRGGTSLLAFELGSASPAEAGFHLVGAHTDSPNLRLKPAAAFLRHGFHQLGVEVYGGALWHTWLDRDLSLAGQVLVREEGTAEVVTQARPLRFDRPLLRIPSLAIHLNRQVNTEGLKLNPQEHLAPIWGLESAGGLDLRAVIAEELGRTGAAVEPSDILGMDLQLFDFQPPSRSGLRGEFLHAPRLDNLASCHAGLAALLSSRGRRRSCGVVLYDHEEVGSTSAQGAASPLLRDALERLLLGLGEAGREAYHRAIARSWALSADMAHALHPNYADRHEPRHQPRLGGGPVLKTNVNQSYATDAEGAALFARLCREVGHSPQHFVTRTDLPCGSTIGPLTAGELGIRTVDVGNPMMSMHSARELAAATDVEKMVGVLQAFFA